MTPLDVGASVVAVAGAMLAVGAVLAAAFTRTLLVSALSLAAAGLGLGVAAAALGYGALGALLACVLVASAPLLILGAILLGKNTAKLARPLQFLPAAAAGVLGLCAVAWGTPELRDVALETNQTREGPSLWAALALFVSCSIGVGLLAYGERGVLGALVRGTRYES